MICVDHLHHTQHDLAALVTLPAPPGRVDLVSVDEVQDHLEGVGVGLRQPDLEHRAVSLGWPRVSEEQFAEVSVTPGLGLSDPRPQPV